MPALQRLLLPTDFSPCATEATRYARTLAERFAAELHLLHVLEVNPAGTPQFGFGLALPTRAEESPWTVEEALHQVLDRAWATEHSVVYATEHGPPVPAILRYAQQHQIDMIVMGTHGRTGLAHAMVGSVAEKVVRKAPCPVLTVQRT